MRSVTRSPSEARVEFQDINAGGGAGASMRARAGRASPRVRARRARPALEYRDQLRKRGSRIADQDCMIRAFSRVLQAVAGLVAPDTRPWLLTDAGASCPFLQGRGRGRGGGEG